MKMLVGGVFLFERPVRKSCYTTTFVIAAGDVIVLFIMPSFYVIDGIGGHRPDRELVIFFRDSGFGFHCCAPCRYFI